MKLLLKYGWILFLVTGLCGSCRNKDGLSEGSGTGKPLEIVAEIKGAEVSKSRAETDKFDSYSSDAGFSAGDEIGFYSMRDEKGDEEGYSNVPMQYDAQEKCFKKEDLIVDYPNNFGYTFAYYPYQKQTEPNVIDIYKDDNTIEDLLIAGTSKISGGRIYLSFVHAFSMLIIVPGNGFEVSASATEPANEVSVTLKEGWKASVVKGDEKIELQLESDENAPKKFVAQRREDVSYAQGQDPVPVCYSVILPNGAEIDHIEMIDDHETTQLIVPQLEALERSWRYPIKVSMEGTTPTVWPYEILPWTEDDSPIKLGGTYGINTSYDFQTWVTKYNRYTSGNLSEAEKTQVIDALKAFGEMTDGKWRFQLNADIDCKGLFGDNQLVVARLTDEFDGKNHTLSNLNTTLIGSIKENGKITDLNIDVVSITSETTEPTGALALEMTGGEISDCDIKNIQIETNGPVGALVGEATAGTISGNTVNGLLLGTASDGLTGVRNESVECVNNQSSALIFWKED